MQSAERLCSKQACEPCKRSDSEARKYVRVDRVRRATGTGGDQARREGLVMAAMGDGFRDSINVRMSLT